MAIIRRRLAASYLACGSALPAPSSPPAARGCRLRWPDDCDATTGSCERTANLSEKQQHFLSIWLFGWAIKDIDTIATFVQKAKDIGFAEVNTTQRSDQIRKSSWLIYFYSILGTIPTKLYGLFHKNATHFGKTHTKAGIVQYKALKQQLWNYYSVVAKK